MNNLTGSGTPPPPARFRNIGEMLLHNSDLYGKHCVFREKNIQGEWLEYSWNELINSIEIVIGNLQQLGFKEGDKMVIYSRNSYKMLVLELAIMSTGGIAVPIFAFFKQNTAELLIDHCDAKYLCIEGQYQYEQMPDVLNLKAIFNLNPLVISHNDLISFDELLNPKNRGKIPPDISQEQICLNMYTSGTMGIPKCVQLTHRNILSQQDALREIWDICESDRFLSYLPWHHSFGGIFELFACLYNGAVYNLEPSYGKDAESIMESWKKAKPTVFFSVPKIYSSLIELTEKDSEVFESFFSSGLKFIFTAAASLPEKLNNVFEEHNIPVIEGWGLTETSPCCTITDPKNKRITGVVGKPIPGIQLRIGPENEIQVKGPNVMCSYYKNEEANKSAFTDDGWYRTGDVGDLTPDGLKLITRKDRIFKLSNGEKVIPTDLEKVIEHKCHYVQYAVVAGHGEEHPVALIFPNKNLLNNPDYKITPEEGCFCPRSINELGRCLQGCLHDANSSIHQKFAKIKSAVVIDSELNMDDQTLTSSHKIAPNSVVDKYKNYLKNMYGQNVPVEKDVYVIELDTLESPVITKTDKNSNGCIKGS